MQPLTDQYEPTIAGAAWQYRWLVIFLAIAFAGAAWMLVGDREEFTARASIVVEDPKVSALFGGADDSSPERYVRSQSEIILSRTVATQAVELMAEAENPVSVSVGYILDAGLQVESSDSSDLITLRFTHDTADGAITGVNAVVAAYGQVAKEAVAGEFDAAILELDSRIAVLSSELLAVQEEIRRVIGSDATRLALEAQLDSALSRLLVFRSSPSTATAAEVAENTAQLDEIRQEIETLQIALSRTDSTFEIQGLLDQQVDLRDRVIGFQLVRDQLEVEAELLSSGVVFTDLAETAVASGAAMLIAAAFILGGAAGAAAAFFLARGRQRFTSRTEPERALGAPLIADVPNFLDERLRTDLPVVEAPASASSEAYRFVSTAIALQRGRSGEVAGSGAIRTVVVTSPTIGAGKTVTAANTAFAAARAGSRVLLVDADFAKQDLTTMLLGSVASRLGLADVIQGAEVGEAVVGVTVEASGSIDLLTAGSSDRSASDLLSSPQATSAFHHLENEYDLVIIDGPPLLTVAYSTTLVRFADQVLVVVLHGQEAASTQDLRHQLEMIGTPVLGYVYNYAPLRAEMALTASSFGPRATVGSDEGAADETTGA